MSALQAIKELADHLKKNGFVNVMAQVEGFPDPKKIYWKTTGRGYKPTIRAEIRDSVCVFELETGAGAYSEKQIEKWKLFSKFAGKMKGKLFLVVPEDQKPRLDRALTANHIQADVLRLAESHNRTNR